MLLLVIHWGSFCGEVRYQSRAERIIEPSLGWRSAFRSLQFLYFFLFFFFFSFFFFNYMMNQMGKGDLTRISIHLICTTCGVSSQKYTTFILRHKLWATFFRKVMHGRCAYFSRVIQWFMAIMATKSYTNFPYKERNSDKKTVSEMDSWNGSKTWLQIKTLIYTWDCCA